MSFPLTYQDDKARRTNSPAPDPVAPRGETGRVARDADEETHVHHVTEEVLNELAKELAKRLNALVDALESQG